MKNKGLITTVIVVVVIIIGLVVWYWYSSSPTEPTPIVNTNTNTNTTTNTSAAASANTAIADYVDVDVDAAYELNLTESDLVILDVSPNFDLGHIADATNYYVGDGSLDAAIPTLDKDAPYLVYCHVDSAAILGAQKLVDAGFPTVYRLVGNYSAWETAGYPISIALDAVGSVSGDVRVTVSYFDNTFFHEVFADIDEPAEGKFYEGWLVQGTDFFSTGQLENIGNPFYVLEYTATEDQRAYNQVVITEETESLGLDGNPETHIFEGTF
ncbi:rhodanese-like domain-containing protein [Patescibacteria group bacterium]|nr:rhodanese-like domain-containing protein [Patescibacteria group bacterium]